MEHLLGQLEASQQAEMWIRFDMPPNYQVIINDTLYLETAPRLHGNVITCTVMGHQYRMQWCVYLVGPTAMHRTSALTRFFRYLTTLLDEQGCAFFTERLVTDVQHPLFQCKSLEKIRT